ncbi:conserved Plasmodium protein, unknown function [Plasmodium gallinaceum]|uniref:Uncharacterized protein n=1 Tax=Plasmodium gallinaceum TaxID=5849 RepID=A0A1J1GRL0_PLAGA|nr:conserved Plasmodium protein, unknown function [Plasmodium gallinaceum]CRG95101.1 conserved Plasmodium protein, unknown function [Plasmodium gallinaceum]
MALLNIKNNANISLHSMRYSDLQLDYDSDSSSNEESPFFSVDDFSNELHSSFDDISDYIVVDESDLKRERSENTSSENNETTSTKDIEMKKDENVKNEKKYKNANYSEESKNCSDNNNDNKNNNNSDNNNDVNNNSTNGNNKKQCFSRTLGTEGRKRMLKLLRKAYKYNEECKLIMKNKNPPLSISYLPYFNLSMLWQLAEDFGVFNEALKIHRECIKKRNSNVRFRANGKASGNYNFQELNKNTKSSKSEYMSDYVGSNMDTQTGEDCEMANNNILNDDIQGKRKRKKSNN